jgi:hypothetical protein
MRRATKMSEEITKIQKQEHKLRKKNRKKSEWREVLRMKADVQYHDDKHTLKIDYNFIRPDSFDRNRFANVLSWYLPYGLRVYPTNVDTGMNTYILQSYTMNAQADWMYTVVYESENNDGVVSVVNVEDCEGFFAEFLNRANEDAKEANASLNPYYTLRHENEVWSFGTEAPANWD